MIFDAKRHEPHRRDIKTFAIKVAYPIPRTAVRGNDPPQFSPHPLRRTGLRGSDVMEPKPIDAVEVTISGSSVILSIQ